MFDYRIDLSSYYPSNENKFNIYVDDTSNLVASNVSLPYVISMNNWKSSYTIYIENLSEGCGEMRTIIVDGQITTTTTINFILTTTQYIPPTTLFTTTTTTTTTSTTITTITTQYVPPTTVPQTTAPNITTQPPNTTPVPPEAGYKIWYNNAKSVTLQKSDCASGCTGTFVTYNVVWGKYSVTRLEGINAQQEADDLAEADIAANGQNYANNNGSCYGCPSTVFYNTEQTITKTRNDCGDCQGTSVNFVVAAGKYQSSVDQNDANQIAINSNQENAQINANLNGQCINCPPQIVPLGISTGVSCLFDDGFVSVGGYNGTPYAGGNYEFKVDGEGWTFGTSYGKSGLSDGIHTAYVRDSKGVEVSQTFNVSCDPPPTTAPPTTAPPVPCSCKSGYVNGNVTYFYTNCQGVSVSGRADVGGLSNICYDETKSHFGVNQGLESNACGGCS